MNKLVIASAMLCDRPRQFESRFVISASDGVWDPVRELPNILSHDVNDEMGGVSPSYMGQLQLSSSRAIELSDELGLFFCFRAVHKNNLKFVDTEPNAELYQLITSKLVFVGFDICTGNGWVSASSHGEFPVDPFLGKVLHTDFDMLNMYSLFFNVSDAEAWCKRNNDHIPEHAPWYPVAVYITLGARTGLINSIM